MSEEDKHRKEEYIKDHQKDQYYKMSEEEKQKHK